jgi:prepilin-type N-terminal cleavage/methylation domain-containing protein
MNKSTRKQFAFTLIELLVVIAIIGILSALIVVSMNGATNSANDARRKDNIDTVRKALIIYGTFNGGTYPVEVAGCNIGPAGILNRCTTLAAALADSLSTPPVDPVSGYYTYVSTGPDFTVSSFLSSGRSYGYSSLTGYHSSIFARASVYTTLNPIFPGASGQNIDDSANGALRGQVFNFTAGWTGLASIGSSYGFQAGIYDVYVRVRTDGLGNYPTSFSSVGIYNWTTASNVVYFNISGLTTSYQVKYAGRFTLTSGMLTDVVRIFFSSSGVTTNYYIDYIEFRPVSN